jgi:2-hydroxychromene-2-carboxylate isomerase
MTLRIECYWSFRSPYSYLATPRIVEFTQRYDLEVDFRPVYPLAVRSSDFFDRVDPMWPAYLARDTHRLAEFLSLPFRWPRPDPVVQLREDGKLRTAPEQPYIHRLTRLGVAASERGRGLAFASEVSTLIWSGEVDGWDEGDQLAQAASRAGLDLAELDTLVVTEEQRLEQGIEANQQAHQASGHWGVPTCVFEGEPFFGQDRLDLLLWRLQRAGLATR